MSYDLRIIIDGYVENCIVQKAQEKYLVKLNNILDELEAKAAELDRREKGVAVVVTDKYDDYYDKVSIYQCGHCGNMVTSRNETNYCGHCGSRLFWDSEV